MTSKVEKVAIDIFISHITTSPYKEWIKQIPKNDYRMKSQFITSFKHDHPHIYNNILNMNDMSVDGMGSILHKYILLSDFTIGFNNMSPRRTNKYIVFGLHRDDDWRGRHDDYYDESEQALTKFLELERKKKSIKSKPKTKRCKCK
jgi:hypothetical protein